MTPAELKAARHRFGLSASDFGLALGYQGGKRNAGSWIRRYERGGAPIPERVELRVRLLEQDQNRRTADRVFIP